jgi:hypothetical protein
MLKHMTTVDYITATICERKCHNVGLQCNPFFESIRGKVVQPGQLAQLGLECALRCKVEDTFGLSIEEIGVLGEKEPDQTMMTLRSTDRAERLIGTSKLEEVADTTATNRTDVAVTGE